MDKKLVPRDQPVQSMLCLFQIKSARKPHRAMRVGGERHLDPPKCIVDKAIAEAGVMRHQQAAFKARDNVGCQCRKVGVLATMALVIPVFESQMGCCTADAPDSAILQ